MFTLLPKGVQTKYFTLFMIENFVPLPPVSVTPVVHLELRIYPRIFTKIRYGPNGILRGLGKEIQEKT